MTISGKDRGGGIEILKSGLIIECACSWLKAEWRFWMNECSRMSVVKGTKISTGGRRCMSIRAAFIHNRI